jgi:hypothetical protein
MKLTTSRKACLALLCLAMTALAVDRLILSPGQAGPAHAQAVSAGPGAPSSPQPVPASAAAPAAFKSVKSVSARLAELARREDLDPAQIPDAFAPPKSWTIQSAAAPAGGAGAKTSFAQTHSLTAVTLAAGRTHAMVSGRMMAVGEKLDGFRLVDISRYSVVFEPVEGGQRVELQLETPAKP